MSKACAALAEYNVAVGTFGYPYTVKVSDKWEPVVGPHSIPNPAECDIVVVDLAPRETLRGPQGSKATSFGTPDFWVKCGYGWIDPRPINADQYHNEFATAPAPAAFLSYSPNRAEANRSCLPQAINSATLTRARISRISTCGHF